MPPPTKATTKRYEAAFLAFNTRYADGGQWGEDRWYNSLYPALAQATKYCALLNRYAVNDEEGNEILSNNGSNILTAMEIPNLHGPHVPTIHCCEQTPLTPGQWSSIPFPIPKSLPVTGNDLLTHWNMDAASVLAAHVLGVQPGDRVLDMCAAPGGKSIVLAQTLFPHLHRLPHPSQYEADVLARGSLHVNEFDLARHRRLENNLKSYLPGSLFPTPDHPQAPIKILNKDLSSKTSVSFLPFGVSGYDKVLIDAPCSSERHIIHAYEKANRPGQIADEMLNWKGSHVTTLVKTQAGLLHTALRAIKVRGTVVYATCALGFEENDGVIRKVLGTLKSDRKKAKRDGVVTEDWDVQVQTGTDGTKVLEDNVTLHQMTEATQYGRIALPDRGGWGPLYFSVMTKTQRATKSSSNRREDDC